MQKYNTLSILCTFIIIFSVTLSHNIKTEFTFSEKDDFSQSSEETPTNYVTGNSFLNITDQIIINSEFNASWYSQVSIIESYGSDLLPNQSMGIRNQIDKYIGDDDGIINSTEISNFTQLII